MLFKCPECDLQVSDKAISCPHCGHPLKAGAGRVRESTKPDISKVALNMHLESREKERKKERKLKRLLERK